jgi:GNAT superfamily N-acetyltransferase
MDISLNVTRGGATPVGSVLRTNQAYAELLAEKTTLDWGIAFCCPQFAAYPGGQQFREVWIESADETPAAVAAAEAHFAERDTVCARWTLAEAQSPDSVEPALAAAGFRREDAQVFALGAWPRVAESSGIRVLPARPMRAAYEKIWHTALGYLEGAAREQAVAAGLERLDDHRMDAFVAMRDKAPAGIAALFQVGDIGRVVDVYVVPAQRRTGVGTALLDHAVQLAKRLTMRLVCTEISTANAGGAAFLARRGFEAAGRIVEFHRKGIPRQDPAT